MTCIAAVAGLRQSKAPEGRARREGNKVLRLLLRVPELLERGAVQRLIFSRRWTREAEQFRERAADECSLGATDSRGVLGRSRVDVWW